MAGQAKFVFIGGRSNLICVSASSYKNLRLPYTLRATQVMQGVLVKLQIPKTLYQIKAYLTGFLNKRPVF